MRTSNARERDYLRNWEQQQKQKRLRNMLVDAVFFPVYAIAARVLYLWVVGMDQSITFFGGSAFLFFCLFVPLMLVGLGGLVWIHQKLKG
jgi:hypothetical protein